MRSWGVSFVWLMEVILVLLVIAVRIPAVAATITGGKTSFRRQALLWQVDVFLVQFLGPPFGISAQQKAMGSYAADLWNPLNGCRALALKELIALGHHSGLFYLSSFSCT